ncbi:hypothetical protein INS49_003883 [Diaporthe citri]|uniref:uncharacterized protein n=1 Tax=Diaporthe citri TaxID=83186 RepID=UPI001C7F62E7|nr:uncharacterized protein INS49_003883 [Diaporthe citri]KAG6354802.1 hypothetical protein INS49_003883 [Diaporthe citri]
MPVPMTREKVWALATYIQVNNIFGVEIKLPGLAGEKKKYVDMTKHPGALAGGSPHPQGSAQRERGPLPTAPDWAPVPGNVAPDVVIPISLGDAMAI